MTATAPAVTTPQTGTPQTTTSLLTRPLVATVGLLFALDVAGAFASVALGLNTDLMDGLGSQARLAAPLPMIAAQTVLLFAATRRPRGLSIPATALLGISGLLGFVSGFFDGGYATEMATGARCMQIALVTTCLLLSFISAVRIVRLSRR